MSWITKNKKRNCWEYRWYDHKGKVRSQKIPDVTTKRDAKKVQAKWDTQREQDSRKTQKPKWTLKQAYDEVKKSKAYSPNYQNNLETFWGRTQKETDKKGTFKKKNGEVGILHYFGNEKLLSEIELIDVINWIDVLKKQKTFRKNEKGVQEETNVKDSTVNHYVNALSRAFRVAMAYRVVDFNPCRHPLVQERLTDDTATRDKVVSPEELAKIFNIASERVKSFLIIAWATGARMGEILTLEWKDLLFDTNEIRFEHAPDRGKWVKSKKTAKVSVHPWILEYLEKNQDRVEGSDWVFCHRSGKRKGERIKDIKKGLLGAVDSAGLNGITSHNFRHSVGSFLGANGVSLATIRDHLRHGDFRMTNRYSHGLDSEAVKASQLLMKALKGKIECLDACTDPRIRRAIELLKESPIFVSAAKTMNSEFRRVERETGLEPATLSLGS